MLKSLIVVVMLAVLATAQTQSGLSGVKAHHKVGDVLSYTVSFDGDPNFNSVTLTFYTSAAAPEQAGLSHDFSINTTQKVGPGKFNVEGKIPENIVSGDYELRNVQPVSNQAV